MIILALKCIALFLFGSLLFDGVHYILHVFETSRFQFLRRLGALHGIHHDFLDRQMKIHRQYSSGNLLHHVLPEYGTAVIGMTVLSYLYFGWVAGAIVISLRTVMVAVYLLQKGEDFTHTELKRIKSRRSLIWVGPHYHALHHIYVRQYYSSFVNMFDMIFGTNCQIKDRRFLVTTDGRELGSSLAQALRNKGGLVQTVLVSSDMRFDESLSSILSQTEVLILAHSSMQNIESFEASSYDQWTDLIRQNGLGRLLPPEVWGFAPATYARRARSYYTDSEITYRYAELSSASPSQIVSTSLFFARRGFQYIPTSLCSALKIGNYFKFLCFTSGSAKELGDFKEAR